MGNVLKGNHYRLVDNHSFDMPLPMKYELYREDSPIAEYEISQEEKVSFRVLTKYKEEMLTPTNRQLSMSDIYFFLSCRVFQDNTPFTYQELSLLGLDRYNVYNILRKTRGITPFDNYWLKFEGDICNYETALESFNELFSSGANGENVPPPVVSATMPEAAAPTANVSEILNQHKIDIEAKVEEHREAAEETAPPPLEPAEDFEKNSMSVDEIEALLLSSGLADRSLSAEEAAKVFEEADKEPEEPAGGMMSEGDIEKMLSGDAEPASTGGKMSQEDIEKMLAATAVSEPEPAPEAPAEEPAPSGGKMSQEDIEKMLAATAVSEPEPAPEATTEEPAPSGGKMSQEDIEKMLAATAVSEPEPPAEEPAPSGGKMSQEDIEKMLAATAVSEPEPAPEAPAEESAPSGGKMSQEDIEKMLANAEAAVTEPAPAPAEEAPASGGKMSQEDIEKMLAGASEPEPAPEATTEEPAPSGGKMSQEDIEKMLVATAAEPEPPAEEPAPSGGKMSQEDIEKMLAGAAEPEPAPEATTEEPAPSGGKMSQEDIEKMLANAEAAVTEPAPEAPAEEAAPDEALYDEDPDAEAHEGSIIPDKTAQKLLGNIVKEEAEAVEEIIEEAKPEEKPASGGKMSQEDIEKMLANAEAAVAEPTPAPAEEAPASGGKMSQADIEALLSGMKEDAAT